MKRYLLSLVIVMSGCSGQGDEVTRTMSPNRSIDAVLIEASGGATTSYWYKICVVPRGGNCSDTNVVTVLYGAARNDQAYGVNMRWFDSQHLIVEYKSVERVSMKRSSAKVGNAMVTIDLRPGIVDPTAPAGGMLYNKNR
jgi:hypothetical protein